MKALPSELRLILEARMIKGYQYQSGFARKYYGQGSTRAAKKVCEPPWSRSHAPRSRAYPMPTSL